MMVATGTDTVEEMPASPTTLRNDDQRRAIVDAAMALLVSEGPDALTTRRMADASAVTTMAIYSRFGGKEGVIGALFEAGFAQLTEHLNGAATSRSPANDLVAVCAAYRGFAVAHPELYSVMFERIIAEFRPTADSATCAWGAFNVLLHRTARVARREVDDPQAHQQAYALWALCHGLVNLELTGMGGQQTSGEYETAFEHGVRTMVRGAMAGPARRTT
jgi:AcrR family transcriptional regulator